METIIGYIRNEPRHICYVNNTGADVQGHHNAILEAINNGGAFNDDIADIFKLTKTHPGSAADWVIDFI